MDTIRDSIIACLDDIPDDNEHLISELNNLIQIHGPKICSTIIHILTHLEMEPSKAAECWDKIVIHRNELSNTLKREINLRTAICDYFCSIDVSLRNPKVVEISIFENKDKASKYDSLTGLYNRTHFDDWLRKEIARSKRHNQELSILFFDLDNFKKINDTYGHLAGDVVLKNVSQIISDEIREEDIAVRYGGEELVVILPQTGKMMSFILGERIRSKIETTVQRFEGKAIDVTVSGGLATFPSDSDNETELLQFADRALYEAKCNGKNYIATYQKHKRRYFRMDFNSEIQVQEINTEIAPAEVKANSKNFSKTGLLFESDRGFNIADQIRIHLPLEKAKKSFTIDGSVVRVEVYEADLYEIGVSFSEMDNDARKDISKFMMKHFEDVHF